MSKFVLAREKGANKLPGSAVALVRSQDPALDGLFLCTVREEGESSSDDEKPHGKRRKRQDKKADIEAALSKMPHAAVAAKRFADSEKIPSTIGKKRKRTSAVGDVESSDDEHEEPPPKRSATAAPSAKADFIKLPIGSTFEPLPCVKPEWRTTGYGAGKSGSGKSVYAANIIRRYVQLFPDRPVYGVCKTKLKDDPAYKDLPIQQVPISFFMTAVDIKKSFGDSGCFVLFDDWDSLEPEEIKVIQGIIADILNLGRKLQISCYVTSHLLTNYNQTRGIIHEADNITLFPQSCMYQSLYYLCNKLGVPKEVIARLKGKGRWITLHNSQPTFVLSETEAEMI